MISDLITSSSLDKSKFGQRKDELAMAFAAQHQQTRKCPLWPLFSNLLPSISASQRQHTNMHLQQTIHSEIRSIQKSETIALSYCLYSVPLAIGQSCVVIVYISPFIIQWSIPAWFLNATKCALCGFSNQKLCSKRVFQYNSHVKAASPCKII